ncbi:MXAN_6640 family putative metalloprotease [Corallococcus carmarthensis]|uniref:MXAN_6640 family putative metalloprotease n=1 Tax=Corallococcus carmarthensis TaxID=2316728 RepID=UPI00148E8D60|nr:MXAN_6640 family putative metalloprotease [Corallococcus carmarthensis]
MTLGVPTLLLLLTGAGTPRGLPHEREAVAGLAAESSRPTSPTSPEPRYLPEDTVESALSPGGRFRIHFTRQGKHAVPAADADGSGVPDFVELVGRTYERVATFYAGLGFRLPPDDTNPAGDDGGDGRFDVYLVDFAGIGDGAFRQETCLDGTTRCTGFMLQENDFAGYSYPSDSEAVEILSSHEFFHAVQAAYRPGLGGIASEGTAVWATERFEPALDDLENFTRGYMISPDSTLTLDPAGPGVSFTYGAGLFFQFLGEHYGDGALVALLEESVREPEARWPVLLDTCLRRDFASSFDAAFTLFATWNLGTGPRATPGFGYARGEGYAPVSAPAVALPHTQDRVRVAAAASRLFEVPGGASFVGASFEPEPGTDPAALHLVLAAVTDDAVLRVVTADGPEALRAQVASGDATRVVVAVVDGRNEGLGRYGRLCIAATGQAASCAPLDAQDAGTDAGTADAGTSDAGMDAGTVDAGRPVDPIDDPRTPDDDGGCQAAGGPLSGALVALLLGGVLRARRRSRAR